MSFTVRMSILGFVLLVALCGLAWEFLVAVPGFNNAQTKLTEISDANIRKTIDEAATMKDIQKVLPQKPSESNVIKPPKKGGEDDKSLRAMTFIRHDKYNFYHALPWKKPETIVVVYQKVLKSEDELDADPDSFDPLDWRLRTVHFNTEPPKTAQRNVSKDAKNPGDVPTAAGGGGPPPNAGKGGPGGGPGGKKGGKGGKGGQRPDPETIFKENDKDKDGKLTGDEIPERMQRFVDNMDEDKDGSITIEEMKAAFARMSQRGGGGRGGPGGAKKGGRPSFDDDKKGDAKTEEKTDAKTEEKADAKTEEKADAKTEEKADAKTEEKADAKTEEKADAKTEEKADAKTEEKADAKTEEKADAKTEEKADAKTEEKADAKTEEKADAKTEEKSVEKK